MKTFHLPFFKVKIDWNLNNEENSNKVSRTKYSLKRLCLKVMSYFCSLWRTVSKLCTQSIFKIFQIRPWLLSTFLLRFCTQLRWPNDLIKTCFLVGIPGCNQNIHDDLHLSASNLSKQTNFIVILVFGKFYSMWIVLGIWNKLSIDYYY